MHLSDQIRVLAITQARILASVHSTHKAYDAIDAETVEPEL